MSRTRIKADALPVPADLDGAQRLLAEIGDLDRAVADIERTLQDEVAGLKAQADKTAATINEAIEARFLSLKAFVEARRDEVLPKGKKSVQWPAGSVGFRDTPLKVSAASAMFDEIVAALRKRRLHRCIRVKTSLDKDELKKVRAKAEDIEGLTFSSRTEFFAKPFDSEVEHVKAVKPPKPRRAGKGRAA